MSVVNDNGLIKTHDHLKLKKPVVFFFVNDDKMLEINMNSLGHNTYTDTITFDYENDLDIEENEVMVSWERVQENAEWHKTTFVEELNRVCIHSLLHLAGQVLLLCWRSHSQRDHHQQQLNHMVNYVSRGTI